MDHPRIAGCGAAGTVALVVTFALAKPVATQEYCIACSSPQAVYRCVLERAAPTGIPLKILCLKTLAREGGHATCSVRSGTVFDCDAPIRRIDATLAAETLTTSPVEAPQAHAPPPQAMKPTPDRSLEPRTADIPPSHPAKRNETSPGDSRPKPVKTETVEDVVQKISRSSKETLVTTGEGIKSVTKKTWNCLTSFFKSC